jgi:hypothetical protein
MRKVKKEKDSVNGIKIRQKALINQHQINK